MLIIAYYQINWLTIGFEVFEMEDEYLWDYVRSYDAVSILLLLDELILVQLILRIYLILVCLYMFLHFSWV